MITNSRIRKYKSYGDIKCAIKRNTKAIDITAGMSGYANAVQNLAHVHYRVPYDFLKTFYDLK